MEKGKTSLKRNNRQTSKTKNATSFPYEIRFRWTWACREDHNKHQKSTRRKPNKNQERWNAKYAKVWALHKDAIKLLTWEPLLIVCRLSYNPVSHQQQETGKIETLSRSYLCLAHSTWARWWRSCPLQVDHLSWLRFAWWRLTNRSPIHQDGSATLRNIFTWPLSPKGWQASRIWFLRDASLELALHLLYIWPFFI